jgi:cell wall-associated NlpC family hydrolase
MPTSRPTLARALGTGLAAVLPLSLVAGALTAPPATAVGVYVTDDLRGADTATLAGQALTALRQGQRARFAILRQRLASLVAPPAGVDTRQLASVWSHTDPVRMTALLSGLTQLGVPYRRLGNTPGQGFDCSGFTSWAWSQAGVSLPHQSGGQIRGAAEIGLEQVQPGDLLYYPGHVMMALGIGPAMVHSPNSGNVVEVKTMAGHRRLRAGNPLG